MPEYGVSTSRETSVSRTPASGRIAQRRITSAWL